MMGYILSVNVSSSEHMWAFSELSTMTDDTSEWNPTCSEDSTLEEGMWHILSFGIVQEKGYIFGVEFGRLLYWLPTGINWIGMFCILVLQSQLLSPLANWAWIWVSWRSYVKINHHRLGWFMRQRRDDYRIHLKDF